MGCVLSIAGQRVQDDDDDDDGFDVVVDILVLQVPIHVIMYPFGRSNNNTNNNNNIIMLSFIVVSMLYQCNNKCTLLLLRPVVKRDTGSHINVAEQRVGAME